VAYYYRRRFGRRTFRRRYYSRYGYSKRKRVNQTAVSRNTIPNILKTKMVFCDHIDITNAVRRVQGLIQLNNLNVPLLSGTRKPYGWTELSGLYNEYMVTKARVLVKPMFVGGTGSTGDKGVNVILWPSGSSSTPSPATTAGAEWDKFMEIPGAVHKRFAPEANEQWIDMTRMISTVVGHKLSDVNRSTVSTGPDEQAFIHIVAFGDNASVATVECDLGIRVEQWTTFTRKKLLP
jgi:hypothetical protein